MPIPAKDKLLLDEIKNLRRVVEELEGSVSMLAAAVADIENTRGDLLVLARSMDYFADALKAKK